MQNPFGKNGEAALEKVRELEAIRQTSLADFNSLLGYLQSYRSSALAAHQRFVTELTRESLDALLVAESLLAGVPGAENLLSNLSSDRYTEKRFQSAHPERRELLKSACQYKLRAAEKEVTEVKANESRHLSADDIEDSPLVKRARSRVKRLEQILTQVDNDADEDVWQRNAVQLLQMAK